MSFPQAPLGVQVDVRLGATWTDITSYVLQRDGTSPPVTITRGRPDESAQVNPAAMGLQLNNRDGRFSVKNPAGPYYGQLTRNTPVRVSVPAQTPYLRLEEDAASYASCPEAAGLDITGDLDLRIDMAPSAWGHAVLAAKADIPTAQESWNLEMQPDGTAAFFWSPDGSSTHGVSSSLPLPLGRFTLRVTLAVADGTVTFYTGPSLSGPWTQLGTAASGTGGVATQVFASTAPVRIGGLAAI